MKSIASQAVNAAASHAAPSLDRAAKGDAPGQATWVVCLCADWCGLCRDYRAVMQEMAVRYPGVRFAWLDIEDQADLLGDVDVETFPTVLIADAQGTRFFGPLQPQPQNLSRLLDLLARSGLAAQPHSAFAVQLLRTLPAAPGLWVRD